MYKKQLLLKLLFCPLLLLMSVSAFAQQITVKGSVTDEKGDSFPGVAISVKGTTRGTNSDINGNYSITVKSTDVLVFTSVGYLKQEIAVNGVPIINVSLKPNQETLDEVVVVGYGTQKRRDLTGSIASVKGEVFKDQPITNPIEALQGRVAGVNVIDASAQPDGVPQIIIRGVASFYQPNPLYIVDGIRQADLNNVNPQDIATIDIAKDAASAAIYGSAAAGGVILITTKKGSNAGAPPLITFSARYGITKPKLVQLLDRDDYLKVEDILNPTVFKGKGGLDTLANTNWVDELYRNGSEQNYNLSISGASANINYLISGFYNQQTGIFIKNYSNIGGARVNTDYKLSKYLTIGEQIDASQRITSPLVGAQASLANAPFRTQPIIPVYNENGSYGTEPAGYGAQYSGPNPLGAVNSANGQDTKNNFQGNAYADLKLPFHLDFRTTLGYSYYLETEDIFQNTYNFGPVSSNVNSLTKSYAQSSQLLTNYVLSYNQNFGKHNISALAGYEQIVQKTNNIYAGESYVGVNGYSFVQTSQSGLNLTGTYDPQGLIQSQFARVNYNYNERYFLSASIRQDANYTVFGPNKQKGVFPGASAGWAISEEPFFAAALPTINSLKLRGSYGQLGNSNIPPYTFTVPYQQNQISTGIAGGAQGFAPGQPFQVGNTLTGIPNPNLQWETITETNIGIDGEALHGSIYFTAEWYNKKTSNMLYDLTLSQSSGFTAPYITNIGDVDNHGFDFMAGYRHKFGKLGVDISANASFNTNKVTKLSGAATDAVYGGYNWYTPDPGNVAFSAQPSQTITITKVGLPFGSFYGYKVIGIFPTDAAASKQKVNGNVAHAGDLEFQDLNGDGNIDASDRQVIGNPNPKMVYGFNLHFNYQGFDLAMLFNGVAGVQLYNGVKAYEQTVFQDGNSTSQIFNDSFFGSNGLTSQPRLGIPTAGGFTLDPNQNYSSVNSYFVESGAYLKLKNLQLGYTFTGNVLKQLDVKGLRVFVMANNLLTFTHYKGLDPELGSEMSSGGSISTTSQGIDAVTNYPQAKIYSVGVDVSFQ